MIKSNRILGGLDKLVAGATALGYVIGKLVPDDKPKVRKPASPSKKYEARMLPSGNLQVDILQDSGNFPVHTSVLDASYFIREWYSPEELEIMARCEEDFQATHKQDGPRKYTGMPSYFHIHGVFRNMYGFAMQRNPITHKSHTHLDMAINIAAMGHDAGIEDNPEHRKLENEWEEAVISGREGRERRIELAQELSNLRIYLKKELKTRLLGYANSISTLKGDRLRSAKFRIKEAVDLIYGLTVRSNEEAYAIAMGHLYTKNRGENYRALFSREFIKDDDKISNGVDVAPTDTWKLKILDEILRDKSVHILEADGEQLELQIGIILSECLGEVNPKAVEMPKSVRLQTAANSILPLHYSGESANRYNHRGAKGGQYALSTDELFGLALLSRDKLCEVTEGLSQDAITMYEKEKRIAKIKDNVTAEIAEKLAEDSTYFDRVTLDGPVSKLIQYDVIGSKFIRSLDKDPERREQLYKKARDIAELIPRFRRFYDPSQKSGKGNVEYQEGLENFDRRIHKFWTLQNVNNLLELMRDPWEAYADLTRKIEVRKSKTFTSFMSF